MNALYIVTAYVLIDDGLKAQHYQDDPRARVSTAEILINIWASALEAWDLSRFAFARTPRP